MYNRKQLLNSISRNALTVNNLLVSSSFANTRLTNLDDIRLICNSRLLTIQNLVDELLEMEK